MAQNPLQCRRKNVVDSKGQVWPEWSWSHHQFMQFGVCRNCGVTREEFEDAQRKFEVRGADGAQVDEPQGQV